MRSILLASLMTTGSLLQAQIATVYVTPPTSGCNGVWAVQALSLYCTSSSPYQFATEPSGCIQLTGWQQDMGNILLPLCAVPCSLTVTTADMVTCSGSTNDAPIGMHELGSANLVLSVVGTDIELTCDAPLPSQQARIMDASGRICMTESLPSGQRWSMAAPGSSGVYSIVLHSDERSIVRRFVVP